MSATSLTAGLRLGVLAVGLVPAAGCSERTPPSTSSPATTAAPAAAPPAVAAGRAESPPLETGFVRLGLDDFDVHQPQAAPGTTSWSADGQTIRCTGKPRGYLYSKRPYANFTLRADLRYPAASDAEAAQGNTGILLYVTVPHRVWPVCLEVQGKYVELSAIKGNGKPNPLEPRHVHDSEPARQQARKPAGDWNALEVVSRDGRVTSRLNGVVVCESEAGALRAGPLGLQAEDRPYEIRNLRIKDETTR